MPDEVIAQIVDRTDGVPLFVEELTKSILESGAPPGAGMTSTVIDAAGPGLLAEEAAGPLEQRHLQYANYRAVADGSKVTRTHWHIALANGLGWGFDGMDYRFRRQTPEGQPRSSQRAASDL